MLTAVVISVFNKRTESVIISKEKTYNDRRKKHQKT